MHPGLLASAGDGCLAGQGDSARLMPIFFGRNIAVEMACFETLSSITYVYIYISIYLYIYIYEYLRANSMVFLYSREPSYIIHTFFT